MMRPEPDVVTDVPAELPRRSEKCVNEYYPDVQVNIEHAEGLAECREDINACESRKDERMPDRGNGDVPGGCIAGCGNPTSR